MISKKGFTLIELLVVVIIMGLILGIGSVRYRDFAKRQVLVNAKRQILADIRGAQSDATSGRKPAGCTGDLTGYEFEVTNGSTGSYRISAVCGNEVEIKTASMPQGVTLSNPSPNPILFRVLSNGTNIANSTTITITNTNLSAPNTNTLEILGSGAIR